MAGKDKAAKMAIIMMITSNSISENPLRVLKPNTLQNVGIILRTSGAPVNIVELPQAQHNKTGVFQKIFTVCEQHRPIRFQ
jgi:hypothetical protein